MIDWYSFDIEASAKTNLFEHKCREYILSLQKLRHIFSEHGVQNKIWYYLNYFYIRIL